MALSKELTINIPARPYVRPAMTDHEDEIKKILAR
jgi:hypothetical protein